MGLPGLAGTSGTSGTGFSTISNPSNNRVLTSDGTVNAAVAESNLTFNDTTNTLKITGTTDVQQVFEVAKIDSGKPTSTTNYDLVSGSVVYYTGTSDTNWTLNFRWSSATSLDSRLGVSQSITATFITTNGAASPGYYATAHQIDGTSVTPKWQGAITPSGATIGGIDVYSYVIIKTSTTPTYTVFASKIGWGA